MRSKLFSLIILMQFASLMFVNSYAQNSQLNNSQPKIFWSSHNPFKNDVFIKNYGQFTPWIHSLLAVKYVINSTNKIFFTQQGLYIKLDIPEKLAEQEEAKTKSKEVENEFGFDKIYWVKLKWIGCNQNALMITSEQTEGYYTYCEKGYESLQAKGFKKLTYKNLYPFIDVEYIIPEKGGIKYSLILHPGADITKVKMQYSGDVENISKDIENGNIIIKTPAGDVLDHSPLSYNKNTKQSINSSFELRNNIVTFQLQTSNSKHQTIIIDPWTTTPTSLTTNSEANDIDYDDKGNVYVSGGTAYFKVTKYSATGTFLWTFTNPSTWSTQSSTSGSIFYYSKFCVLRSSGSVFIGEGLDNNNSNPGPMIMKVNSSGNLILTSNHFPPCYEIWQMFYNKCSGKLIGFGGGTNTSNNLQLINDTNISGSNCINFNNYTTGSNTGNCFGNCNDIACVVQDNNGDFYALMSSKSNTSSNRIQKSLFSSGYFPPLSFDVLSGYNFNEAFQATGYSSTVHTVRVNALALNNNYLFSFDGQTLKAWNKTNGNQLASVVVNAAYVGGEDRANEGIEADDCNNIYVGGHNAVHRYTFNGTAFTLGTPITANINGYVRDIRLSKSTCTLYISGTGFVTVAQSNFCIINPLTITHTLNIVNCVGTINVAVTGGMPPYTYNWNTGATTNTISGLSAGTYIVSVTDNSCNINKIVDTVKIAPFPQLTVVGDTDICLNSSTILNATGFTSYHWTPGNMSTANITVTPSITTTYTCIGFSSTCNDTAKVTVHVHPIMIVASDSFNICKGSPITLTASGVNTYTWTPGGLSSASITVSPLTNTTYTVIGSSPFCTDTTHIKVYVHTIPIVSVDSTVVCSGRQATLTASGANNLTYVWSNGFIGNPLHVVASYPKYYTVVATDPYGCKDSASGKINILPIPQASFSANPTYATFDNPLITFTDYSLNAILWQWNFGDILSPNNTSSIPSPVHTFAGVGEFGVWLTVVNSFGCRDSAYQRIMIENPEIIYIPNAIIPSSLNPDVAWFKPKGLGFDPQHYLMVIYDRWGQELFSTPNPDEAWKGKYHNVGDVLPCDVYVYYIKVKFLFGKEKEFCGRVTIVR